jgi:aspartate/methionine/tyrosine aminotransferase
MAIEPIIGGASRRGALTDRVGALQLPEYEPLIGTSVGAGERALERLSNAATSELLNLTYANTHRFPAPSWATEQLIAAASGHGPSYTAYRGDAEVRNQVAASVSSFLGVSIDPETELILTPGTQAALFCALTALVENGDRVVLPDPDYLSDERLIRLAGGTVDRVELEHGDGVGAIDPDEIVRQLSDDTSVILFSNPNNPTGAVYGRDVLEAIAAVACERDLVVIVDELYSRLVYDGREYVHLASLDGMKERTVTLLGPSKTESMSGFRLGVACGPARIVTAMEDILGLTVLRAPAYAQWALVPWLRDDHEFVAQRIEEYQKLRDMTVGAFSTLDFATLSVPAGTAYAFPSIAPLRRSDNEIAGALIEQAGVIVNPGYQFGRRGIGSFRICFAQEETVLESALQRIASVLETLA